jgi:pyruvate dehydrogenase E2 component (dihydrolipoamide acetyltransferase)
VRSSPLARRLASERGVDLHAIAGSGPNGRIIKRDIDEAATHPATTAAAGVPAGAAGAAGAAGVAITGAEYRDVPLTQIRRTIARRLAESIGPIPTFYLTAEFDLERVSEMRAALSDEQVNAHWLGDKIRYFARVHLGMAVAIEDGLITPVLFDADRKRLRDLSRETKELAAKARARKLTPAEYTGSTFSVSNLGMFGIDQFTAIINPPEAGILAIGSIEPKPVATGDTVTIRKRMRVTMSCDHRVIDGATGARFLSTLRRLLENPLLLVY